MGIRPHPRTASFATPMGTARDSGAGHMNDHIKYLPDEWRAFLEHYYRFWEFCEDLDDPECVEMLDQECANVGLTWHSEPAPHVLVLGGVGIATDYTYELSQGPKGKEYWGARVFIEGEKTNVALVEAGEYSHVGDAEMVLASEDEDALVAVVEALGIDKKHIAKRHQFIMAF